MLELHFPDHEVIVEIDNPNSIHAFNRFEEEGHTEQKYNHFRLIDLTREELYAMGVPAILDDDKEEKKFVGLERYVKPSPNQQNPVKFFMTLMRS